MRGADAVVQYDTSPDSGMRPGRILGSASLLTARGDPSMPLSSPPRQRPLARQACRLLAGSIAVTLASLAGCAGQAPRATPGAAPEPLPAWVELSSAPIARAVVPAGAGC